MYINVPQWLARWEANLLTSNNYFLDGKDEKKNIIKKFFKKINFDNLLKTIIENNSIYGKSILAIDRDIKGELIVYQPDYLSNAEVYSDNLGDPELVILVVRTSNDGREITIKRYFTKNAVWSDIYETDEKGNTKKIESRLGIVEFGGNKIQKFYRHNLGVVPVVLFYNYNYTIEKYVDNNALIQFNSDLLTRFTNSYFKYYFLETTTFAKESIYHLNECYERLFGEWILQGTNIFISGGAGGNTLDETMGNITPKLAETYKKFGFISTINGRDLKIDIKKNDNKLNDLKKAIDDIWRDIFNFCYYSYFNETGGTKQITSEEMESKYQLTIQTCNAKQEVLNSRVNFLIDCILKINGYDENDDINFSLNSLSLQNISQLTDSIVKQVQEGILDREQGMKELHKTYDDEQIKEILANSEKETENENANTEQSENPNT